MKLLRHILMVIALMAAVMPCCHADAHDLHSHGAQADAGLCASHACACHSCEETPCGDKLDMPQNLTVASASVVIPSSPIRLFIFTEAKPVTRQAPPKVTGILATLQTVQLLI
ncbi:MAG: hypothetical protein U9P12_08405 [Verrucomicrobiota bacterium]|nr:hypothetical protein [Verrucomicrobiota bacterium]